MVTKGCYCSMLNAQCSMFYVLCSFLYAGGVLFRIEWCTRQLWSISIILWVSLASPITILLISNIYPLSNFSIFQLFNICKYVSVSLSPSLHGPIPVPSVSVSPSLPPYIHTYTYTYTYTYTPTHLYIFTGAQFGAVARSSCLYIYIYIYIYTKRIGGGVRVRVRGIPIKRKCTFC